MIYAAGNTFGESLRFDRRNFPEHKVQIVRTL